MTRKPSSTTISVGFAFGYKYTYPDLVLGLCSAILIKVSLLLVYNMVKYALKVSCSVENLNQLSTSGPDFEWNLKLHCRDCNEADPSWHAISENEEVEGKHGPGTFNFQMKCKFCSNVATVDVVKGSIKPLRTNDNNLIDNQLAVIFDCRGVEPVAFDPQGTWIAKSDETNTLFDDVEFGAEEDSWAGYDEKGKCPVIIENFKSTFERRK